MKEQKSKIIAIILAILAAILYAINTPFSKLLLNNVSPTFLASFLYLGAGIGVGIMYLFHFKKEDKSERLTLKDLPYTILMIVLDIAAPILLMIGLSKSSASNASLLENFEIVATSILALIIFKEKISYRLWIAIGLITISCIVLSYEGISSFNFSIGSLFIILATCCWGFENNCTRKISGKSTYEIVLLKGILSGLGSFIIALILKEKLPEFKYILVILLLGFLAYGLSIFMYVRSQHVLGAAKTSAYYAIAPFVGTFLSLIINGEVLTIKFFIGLLIMLVGSIMVVYDTLVMSHCHMHTHVIVTNVNGVEQTQVITHSHYHEHVFNEDDHHHHHHKN